MTKSDRILALAAEGKTTREIALLVYRLPASAPWKDVDRKMAYVRVVLNQRKGSSSSPIDDRYYEKRGRALQAKRYKARYWGDPAYRQAELKRAAAYYSARQARAESSS